MPTASSWRSRPIFVSSTFADFQRERDLLQNLVFPELAERLLATQHGLEPVDLRFGIETVSESDEEQKALLVLNVCLQEVVRSRPFLIVLLGARYGWRPPVDRAHRAAEEAGLQLDTDDKSVTELEIEAGLFQATHGQPIRAFAYFRELDPSSVPAAARRLYFDPDTTRIEALKSRIREVLGDSRCRTYKAVWEPESHSIGGIDELRRMLVEDVWSDLKAEAELDHVQVETWGDRERNRLNAFVHQTAQDFMGREALLDRLFSVATGPNDGSRAMCVTGVSGSGKSSIAAELIRRLRDNASVLLLANAAGISPESIRIDRMLQRWSGELATYLGEAAPAAEGLTGDNLERAFATLLERASRRERVVVVLDALNEFERTAQARHLTWLPRVWPANARLITTSIPGIESDSLTKRTGCELLQVDPLTRDEAKHIVDAVYRRYRRQANAQVKQAIVEKRTDDAAAGSGNPLWLELACEEMNLLDPDDLARAAQFTGPPDAQLTALQLEIAVSLPRDVQAMYGRMLKRAESVASTILREQHPGLPESAAHAWVECFSQAIATSRSGWREYDLQRVLPGFTRVPWSELLFASVRRAFRGHILQRGASGQWYFYHQQLHAGVAAWFNSRQVYLRDLHAALASHLDSLPQDNLLRQTERMHHLIGANDSVRAAQLYASCEHGSNELRAATESLVDLVRSREGGIDWIGKLLSANSLSLSEQLLLSEKIMFPLVDALGNEGYVEQRRALLQMVRDQTSHMADHASAPIDRQFASRQHSACLVRLADLASDVGDLSQARPLYEEHLRFAERQAADFPDLVTAQQDLAVALERLGDLAARTGNVDEACAYFRRELDICRQVAAIQPEDSHSLLTLAQVLERLGNLALDEGDAAETESFLGEAAILRGKLAKLAGEEISAAAIMLQARVAESKDEGKEARDLYKKAEAILRQRAEAAPEDVEAQVVWSTSLESLGDLALFHRDTAEATAYASRSLEICARLASLLPEDIATQDRWANALMKVGDAVLREDRPDVARPYYARSLVIHERLHALLPGDVRRRRNLGLAYERLGMLDDVPSAERVLHLERALAIYTDLHDSMPDQELAARMLALGEFALAQILAGIPERKLESIDHASRAHELLCDLRARERQLDPAAKRVLSLLDTQFGGSGRWTHSVAEQNQAEYGEANMLGMLGSQELAAGNYSAAEKSLSEALCLATKVNHPPTLVRVYGTLGELRAKTGNPQEALELLHRAVAVARDNDLPTEEGQTLERIADLYADMGLREKALGFYKQRLAAAELAGNQRGVAFGSANIGVMYFETQDFASAVQYLEPAAELFDSYRMLPQLAHAYSYLGAAYQASGDSGRAIETYARHIDLCSKIGDIGSAAGTMANLSLILYSLGERDRAIEFGEQASDVLEQMGSPQAAGIRAKVHEWKRAR